MVCITTTEQNISLSKFTHGGIDNRNLKGITLVFVRQVKAINTTLLFTPLLLNSLHGDQRFASKTNTIGWIWNSSLPCQWRVASWRRNARWVFVCLCGGTARSDTQAGADNLMKFSVCVKRLSDTLTTAALRTGNNTELEFVKSQATTRI